LEAAGKRQEAQDEIKMQKNMIEELNKSLKTIVKQEVFK
tara:strand:+ start:1311 stop:1427 length:117 start_codon:yes stop_codon:yes gene_type:complete